MTDDIARLTAELEAKAKLATPGPWCIESCGEKGDGSNIIGVAFGPGDEKCERPLSGWLEPFDDEGNEIDYYRDEEIAELGHRTRNHSSDAAYIAACSPDNILKLLSALTAAQARLAALEGALRDCVDAMHEDNPASGWKEIIDNGRAALSGSPSADPRDAVIADLRDDLARILTDCASAPTPDFSNADCRHRCAVIARAALSRLTKDKAHG